MAVRKSKGAAAPAKGSRKKNSTPQKKGKSPSWAVLFWLAFVIVIIGLYIFNREAIGSSIQTIKNEYASKKNIKDEKPVPPLTAGPVPAESTQPPAEPPARPPAEPSATAATTPAVQAPPPAPANQNVPTAPQSVSSTAQPASSQITKPTTERRERVLYFSQVDRDGTILRVKVNRNLPVSDSPMTDVIQAIINGPSWEEKNKGLISLIPSNTKILSAAIRDDTAYISFNEDFQYNTYGVEGYAGQIRQIVFTATEFTNVKKVQILIEGRRVDYLGEGVWIGGPLNRDILQ